MSLDTLKAIPHQTSVEVATWAWLKDPTPVQVMLGIIPPL